MSKLVLIAVLLGFGSKSLLASYFPTIKKVSMNEKQNSEWSFEQVEDLLEKVKSYYQPIIENQGSQLRINVLWDSDEVNAYARKSSFAWSIDIHKGIIDAMDGYEDALLMVACHELGHLLGGYPTKPGSWSAAEGQADYFATQVCMKNILREEVDVNKNFNKNVNLRLKQQCDHSWIDDHERNLCYRIGMASVGSLAFLGGMSLDERSSEQVNRTYVSHNDAQCRLDTYISGNLCVVEFEDGLIPSSRHFDDVSCMRSAGYDISARPRCWFKPW